MNFFWDDDNREMIPLMEEDAVHLWATMLADGIEEWLDEITFREYQAEETL